MDVVRAFDTGDGARLFGDWVVDRSVPSNALITAQEYVYVVLTEVIHHLIPDRWCPSPAYRILLHLGFHHVPMGGVLPKLRIRHRGQLLGL